MIPIRTFTAWLAILGLCALVGTAAAQGRGRGGPRMSPEDAAKAWKLQASSVAATLDLTETDAAALEKAYETARRDHGEAMREAMSGGRGGDPMARFEKIRELNEAYAANLTKALDGQIDADSAEKAVAALVVFDRRADRMTLALDGLDLENTAMNDAMSLVGTYAAGTIKATEEAIKSMDMSSMRTARQALRTALNDGMSSVLNEEQLAAWKEKTQFRGRGGRGGRGGFGGRGGRGQN